MVRILKIREFEQRKRALVAESEVYRRTLAIEFDNLRLYGETMKQKFRFMSALQPLLMLALPLAGSLFRRKKRRVSWMRMGLALLLRSGLHHKLGVLLGQFFAQNRPPSEPRAPEEQAPEANI